MSSTGGFDIHVVEDVSSSQDEALRRAQAGAPAGTVVWAQAQSAGRGRRGRSWVTHAGSLAFSLVWRGTLVPEKLPRLTLCTAAGVASAFADEDIWIKWPNDLMVPHAQPGVFGPFRKWGGILVEGSFAGGRLDAVIIGVGLNLVPPPGGFDPALSGRAGSLWPQGTRPDDEAVLHAVLNGIAAASVRAGDDEAFAAVGRGLWARSILAGRQVVVDGVHGRARGIGPNGALLVEQDGGQVVPVSAGEVSLAEHPPTT